MSTVKLAEVTIGVGGASTLSFTNIPQGYTDLHIVYSLRSNRTSANLDVLRMTFNGNASGYSVRTVIGFGSGNGYSETVSGQTSLDTYGLNGPTATANTFASGKAYIPNYAGNTNKTVSLDWATEDNVTAAWNGMSAGLWANTSAITSISFAPLYGTLFVQYSTATLYGISKVPSAGITPKATGGDIYQNGAYTYHVFKASGTFTPTVAIPNAEMLVIAGGGGGGGGSGVNSTGGAGGGAGGLLQIAATSLSSGTPLTVTVGGGGNGGAAGYNFGTSGTNSSCNSNIAIGGGGGAYGTDAPNAAGLTGGSAGGSSYGNNVNTPGTAGQGNAGGAGASGGSGGGGGAGAAGGNGVATFAGGIGGAGLSVASFSSGTSTGVSGYYAGGGGGGTFDGGTNPQGAAGGIGGGGNGGGQSTGGGGIAGTTNTGGGGGGGARLSSSGYAGAAGGSGIVIVRYA